MTSRSRLLAAALSLGIVITAGAVGEAQAGEFIANPEGADTDAVGASIAALHAVEDARQANCGTGPSLDRVPALQDQLRMLSNGMPTMAEPGGEGLSTGGRGAGGQAAFVPVTTYHLIWTPTPAVPEPAVWAMLLAGVGAVGWAARRRGATHA